MLTPAQPIKTLLGAGTKRAAGTDEQVRALLGGVDFELATAQWGFDKAPDAWLDTLIEQALIEPEDSVLIPCAGRGTLADRVVSTLGKNGYQVLEVQEREPKLRDLLSLKGYRLAELHDLLSSEDTDLYNAIVVFPPHHRGREADYLRQCYRMLAPSGRMAALVADSVFYHSRPECHAFRQLFRALRKVGRAGYIKLEDEEAQDEKQGDASGDYHGQGRPEDGENRTQAAHALPDLEADGEHGEVDRDANPDTEDEKDQDGTESHSSDNAKRTPSASGAMLPSSGPATDEDGDGGRAFEHVHGFRIGHLGTSYGATLSPGLGSPFFSPLAQPAQAQHRPDPYQGKYWRIVWMQRGPERYAQEAFDDHAPFQPDDEPLVMPKMSSRSIPPKGGMNMPHLSPPKGGLQPSAPQQALQPPAKQPVNQQSSKHASQQSSQPLLPKTDDLDAQIELELELIKMRLAHGQHGVPNISGLSGKHKKRKLTLAKARLKLR